MWSDHAFKEAVAAVTALPDVPRDEDKLRLYGLYKQATVGPAPKRYPGSVLNVVEFEKYKAWSAVRPLSINGARREYVALVKELQAAAQSGAPRFMLNERVEYRDDGTVDWHVGTVHSVNPLKVKPDGWDSSHTFDELRSFDPNAPSTRVLVGLVFLFKLLQFVDRGITSGSPTEFNAFIERTTGAVEQQAVLFASISSAYTVGNLAGCVGALGLHRAGYTGHRLLRTGMTLWLVGIVLSSWCSALGSAPLVFYLFCTARLLVGVGAGAVVVSWPPYIESIAMPTERSMAMTLVEMGTSLGAATGYLYSATMTRACGWGAAYFGVAFLGAVAIVAPMCVFNEPYPYTRARRPGESVAVRHQQEIHEIKDPGFLEWLEGLPTLHELLCGTSRAHKVQRKSMDVPIEKAGNGGNDGNGGNRGKLETVDTSASLLAQLETMCSSPALVFLFLGLACASGGMQGLQVFFPTIGIDVGIWPSEIVAAASFGTAIVLGAVVGSPMHGVLASWMTQFFFVTGSGGSREAAVLLGIMGCTTLAGAVVGTGLLLAIETHSAGLAWKIMALSGALLLGSLGLQVRAPLLLVPPSMGPLAVLASTICGFAGEFAGPLIAGVIKDWYAPNCAVIDLGDGSSGVGPLCASPADQHGLLLVLGVIVSMTSSAGVLWLAGSAYASRQLRGELPSSKPDPYAEPATTMTLV